MRAEMTIGIDLKKLEDLKIFNGYETCKTERQRSFETPVSSPDNGECDSDQYSQVDSRTKTNGTRQKCGRPANPVPRHKRESHIKAEYKRRDKIQKGLDSLLSMVPELSECSKESKSAMLFKSAEYCRRLKSEYGIVQCEMTALRQELESLGRDIHELQDELPKQGASVVDKETLQMDALYDEYVREETNKNWKFWIFGFFVKPLYKSYRVAATGTHSSLEFSKVVIDWVKDAMSLSSLRKGFLESLRKLSTRTDVMTHPERLQKEASQKVTMHCVMSETADDKDQEVVYRVTPTALTYTPRTTPRTTPKTTPKQTPKVTPVATPTPTPPRTPTSSRRNKRRESRPSKESRSRSNSPQADGSRLKRRPSNRSEKRHYSGEIEDGTPLMYPNTVPHQFTFTQPAGVPAKRVSPVPVDKNIPYLEKIDSKFIQPDRVDMLTEPTTAGYRKPNFLSSVSYTEPPQMTSPQFTKADDTLLTRFIGTLSSLLQADQKTCLSVDQGALTDASSTVFTCSDAIMSIDLHQPLLSDTTMPTAMESSNEGNQSAFLPINRPGVITHNTVLPVDSIPLVVDSNDSLLSELPPLPYESYTSSHTDNLSILGGSSQDLFSASVNQESSFIPPTVCSSSSSNNQFDGACASGLTSEKQDFVSCDDDSIMKMLTFDVMDVNNLMNFFNEQPHTKQDKTC